MPPHKRGFLIISQLKEALNIAKGLRLKLEHIVTLLRQIDVLTTNGKTAAQAMVWDNILNWWEDANLQAVRRDFCERYARIPDRPLDVV